MLATAHRSVLTTAQTINTYMKKAILIPLALVAVLAVASNRGPVPVPAKCECICPSLDTLIKEKEEADREAQRELGRLRRQTLKDKLSPWFKL